MEKEQLQPKPNPNTNTNPKKYIDYTPLTNYNFTLFGEYLKEKELKDNLQYTTLSNINNNKQKN